MTFLERVQVARADEQMRSIDMAEPVKHDGWSIKPTDYDGRRDGKGKNRGRCLACGSTKIHRASSYCYLHWNRVVRDGNPWDNDLYRLTARERKALNSGRRFGGPLAFVARASDTREGR